MPGTSDVVACVKALADPWLSSDNLERYREDYCKALRRTVYLLQVMSAQPTIEGEAAGPDYGSAAIGPDDRGTGHRMLNGVEPSEVRRNSQVDGSARVSSGQVGNGASVTGPGASTYGAVSSGTQGSGTSGSEVRGGHAQQQQPQPPDTQQQPVSQNPVQQQPVSQNPAQQQPDLLPLPQQSLQSSLPLPLQSEPIPVQQVAMPALRLEAPRLQEQERAAEPVATADSFMSARSSETVEGGVRNVWMSFGEMFQRRFVNPVRSFAGQSTSMLSGEMQQAMQVHATRDTLISLQRRRAEEDGSSSSLNQDMILEEVRRQVGEAMRGRDQEVHLLRQRNEELERALVEANTVMRARGAGGGVQSTTTESGGAQGRLGDNPSEVAVGVKELPRAPDPVPQRSGVPGGNLSGAHGSELHCEAGLSGPPGLGKAKERTMTTTRAPVEVVVSALRIPEEEGTQNLCIF